MALVKKLDPNRNIRSSVVSNMIQARVLADRLLSEVFTNLLSNSVRCSKDELVELGILLEDGEGTEGKLRISIVDNGSGIPDHAKGNIFSRYQKSMKGSGLGMSIAHAIIVQRYVGEIRVKDRVKGIIRKEQLWRFYYRKLVAKRNMSSPTC